MTLEMSNSKGDFHVANRFGYSNQKCSAGRELGIDDGDQVQHVRNMQRDLIGTSSICNGIGDDCSFKHNEECSYTCSHGYISYIPAIHLSKESEGDLDYSPSTRFLLTWTGTLIRHIRDVGITF